MEDEEAILKERIEAALRKKVCPFTQSRNCGKSCPLCMVTVGSDGSTKSQDCAIVVIATNLNQMKGVIKSKSVVIDASRIAKGIASANNESMVERFRKIFVCITLACTVSYVLFSIINAIK